MWPVLQRLLLGHWSLRVATGRWRWRLFSFGLSKGKREDSHTLYAVRPLPPPMPMPACSPGTVLYGTYTVLTLYLHRTALQNI
jgi:hypothetical protein